MLKAGSLTYAIFLSLIAAMLCALMIMLVYWDSMLFTRVDFTARVEDALASGLAKAQALKIDDSSVYFNEEINQEVRFKTRPWGAYQLISSSLNSSDKEQVRAKLLAFGNQHLRLALYQPDQNDVLALSGDARLKGDVRISTKGLKSAFINGDAYSGEHLVYGKQGSSTARLPELAYDVNSYWKRYLSGLVHPQDSLVNSFGIGYHGFDKPTAVVFSESEIELRDRSLEGNWIVVSQTEIRVSEESHLKNLILIAPVIRIESKAKIRGHLIAKDSIVIKTGAKLHYPSTALIMDYPNGSGQIRIEKDARVEGALVHLKELPYKNNQSHLLIAEGAVVVGTVYCRANMQLLGRVTGSVFAQNFIAKTRSGIFENTILNGVIDRGTYKDSLLFLSFKEVGYPHVVSKL